MTECCQPRGYERVFTTGQAERDAARYHRKGLTWAPRRTHELYRDGTIDGRTLLEVGGGVGDLQVDLLRAGVEETTSVELSGAYEPTARRLLEAAGLADRSTRLVGDFTTLADRIGRADLVVLHSVVCCYADPERLLAAAASKAHRHLVVSYPRATWWLHAWAPVQNLYPRLRGSDFRFFVHSPALLVSTVERAGLRRVHIERHWIDDLAVFTRSS